MYCDFACVTAIMHFVANYVKFCKNAILGDLHDLLQYYIPGGGEANLLQYYMVGGSSDTPKLYYVIYEQPLMIRMYNIRTIVHILAMFLSSSLRPIHIFPRIKSDKHRLCQILKSQKLRSLGVQIDDNLGKAHSS